MTSLVDVSQADELLAARCIPAAVIFAEAEDHVADLRQRAAQHIATARLTAEQAKDAEIERLNAECERAWGAYRIAHDQAMDNGERAQRCIAEIAELTALLREAADKLGWGHNAKARRELSVRIDTILNKSAQATASASHDSRLADELASLFYNAEQVFHADSMGQSHSQAVPLLRQAIATLRTEGSRHE